MKTIRDRLTMIETKLRYIEKLLYGMVVLILADYGIQVIV